MKEILTQYAEYNIWANTLIIDAMMNLPEDAVDKKIDSSFDTIRTTVYHCWSAEDIWLQRLLLAENPVWAESTYQGTFKDACFRWQQASGALFSYITGSSDEELKNNISFKDRKGQGYYMPPYQILHHVFNHSTYHRGQLVTMLRQTGETKIPGTDFITFARLTA